MTNYYHNETIYCSQCNKLRYMGYTDKPDSELCTCADQDNIPTIIKYKAFSMSEKTPDQLQSEENARIQNDTWLKGQRIKFREIALLTAQNYHFPNASQTLEEADKIYDWLINAL